MQRLGRFRNRVLAVWLGTNATLITLLSAHCLGNRSIVDPAIWWLAVTDAAIACTAVGNHPREGRHRGRMPLALKLYKLCSLS